MLSATQAVLCSAHEGASCDENLPSLQKCSYGEKAEALQSRTLRNIRAPSPHLVTDGGLVVLACTNEALFLQERNSIANTHKTNGECPECIPNMKTVVTPPAMPAHGFPLARSTPHASCASAPGAFPWHVQLAAPPPETHTRQMCVHRPRPLRNTNSQPSTRPCPRNREPLGLLCCNHYNEKPSPSSLLLYSDAHDKLNVTAKQKGEIT
ncbi:hypothetical protein TREES_T100016004 [Tupaia chinensis]|uniref:Uncharacterized protein n=1 Tax=Tupaia chinensis TaxID=246437 RepID=L9KKI0_TUPCH|nr:hypothetical protein TREES_T100016004 [Tupaia chinensis]